MTLRLASLLLLFGGGEARATSVAQDCSGGGFLVSAIAVTGLAVFDIATAPASARRYNARHLAVVPRLDPRHGSYGFAASWSFGRPRRAAPRVVRTVAAPTWKSPGTALLLSAASTTGPILAGVAIGNGTGAGLFLTGLIVGPSVGHFYAGQAGRGLGTIVLRAGGTVAGLYSLVGCFSD